MQASLQHWQNSSSLYRAAGMAHRLLEEARDELAEMFDLEEPHVVFTSGATEANNAVMEHAASACKEGARVVISPIEHPSLRAAAEKYFGEKRVCELPVDSEGRVCLDQLAELLAGDELALVSVMAANNETGVIQPWREIGGMCRSHAVSYHCDAAQWIGKQALAGLGDCDFLSGSAHKFGGPKGVGFLILGSESASSFTSQVGGPQEGGRRAGTEDYPGVAAMMAALRERLDDLDSELLQRRLGERRAFEKNLLEKLPEIQIVAQDADRLWNTVMLILPESGPTNLKWLIRLDRLGFEVSTGSACSAGKGNPSHVMQAMALQFDQMSRVIRVSGGWQTEASHWNALTDALQEVWGDLKEGRRAGSL